MDGQIVAPICPGSPRAQCMTAGCRSDCRRGPVLVTGSHRSGTTWVGKMLASHPSFAYLSEPFSPHHRPPGSPVRCFMEYVTPESAPAFEAYLRRQFRFPAYWWSEVAAQPHPRRIVGTTLRLVQAYWRRIRACRPLMKDPLALMSAEWLAHAFGMKVIVLIRHPAAYAGSAKRLGARLAFHVFQRQPALIERYLQPFVAEIDDHARRQAAGTLDLLDESILIWRLIHHVIRRYQLQHPNWCFARHEDLSRQPLEGFRRLFDYSQTPWTARSERVIAEHSSAENPHATAGNLQHQLKLNSKANIWSWQRLFSPAEITRMRAGTEDVAHHFYSDADWRPEQSAAA